MRTRRLLITRELRTSKEDKTSKTSWPNKAKIWVILQRSHLDQVLKEAKRIPEEILGKVSIAVSV